LKTLLLLLLSSTAFAGGPRYGYSDAKLDDEINNIYKDIRGVLSSGIRGTTAGDAAAAGFVGEYISANVNTNLACAASSNIGDLTSISLTAGDWDVTGVVRFNTLGSSTFTGAELGISITSGNSYTGLSATDNYVPLSFQSIATSAFPTITIPPVRLSLAATTDTPVYLKFGCTYTGTAPGANGSIKARRVR